MNANLEKIDLHRRHLFGAAAAAAAHLGMLSSANAQSAKPTLPLVKPGTHVSFAPLKRINAGLLNVAYAEAGPADGPRNFRSSPSPPSRRERRQRCAASGAQFLCQEVHGPLLASAYRGWHRAQPAPGRSEGLRRRDHRRRPDVTQHAKRDGFMSETSRVVHTDQTHTTGGPRTCWAVGFRRAFRFSLSNSHNAITDGEASAARQIRGVTSSPSALGNG